MIVLKTFLRQMKKAMPSALGYFVIFFVIVVTISSQMGQVPEDKNEIVQSHLRIAMIDDANTPESQHLLDYFQKRYKIEEISSERSEVEEALFSGFISAYIHIPEDYLARLEAGEIALYFSLDSRNSSSWIIEGDLDQYLRYAKALMKNGKVDLERLDQISNKQSTLSFLGKSTLEEEGRQIAHHYFFRFASYVTLSISILLYAQIMSQFNDPSMRARTLVSGTTNASYQKQIMVGLLVISLMIFTVFSVGSVIVYGEPVYMEEFLVQLVNFAVFCVLSLTVGYLAVSITRNGAFLSAFANAVPLGLAFISGVFVDAEVMGDLPIMISKAFPLYYYVKTIQLGDVRFTTRWQYMAIQLAFAALYLLIALLLNRSKKSQEAW